MFPPWDTFFPVETGMRGLRRLLVDGAEGVIDKELLRLAAPTNLEELTLFGWPQVSDEAVAELRRALPRCRIPE